MVSVSLAFKFGPEGPKLRNENDYFVAKLAN